MREHILEFLNGFDYEEAAKKTFLAAYDRIAADPEAKAAFDTAVARYETEKRWHWGDENLRIVSRTELPVETVDFLLLLGHTRFLRELYRQQGIDDKVYHTSMCDLLYKCVECKLVKGIFGTFVTGWFGGFFDMTRFGFGKLQFEPSHIYCTYEKDGFRITPETRLINVHIPRTGGHLDPESRKQSYAQAADFFSERFGTEKIFCCSSWLLFPRNYELLSPGSNLIGFMDDYDLYNSGEYDDYHECWRLFDTMETDPDKLPADSSFRRAYIDLIRKGEKTGYGQGIYIYR